MKPQETQLQETEELTHTEAQPFSSRPYHHGALREALMETTHNILENEGLQAFTLRECARRAGVSHTAPAHHFGDRGGLLAAYAARAFEQLADQMRHFISQAEDNPEACLIATGSAYVQYALENPQTYQLMFRRDSRKSEMEWVTLQEPTDPALILKEAMRLYAGDAELEPKCVIAWSFVHGFCSLALEGRIGDATTPGGRAMLYREAEIMIRATLPMFREPLPGSGETATAPD